MSSEKAKARARARGLIEMMKMGHHLQRFLDSNERSAFYDVILDDEELEAEYEKAVAIRDNKEVY